MQHVALALGMLVLVAWPGVPPAAATHPAEALAEFRFASIDGGDIGFSDWPGRPVLIANTASLCSYTSQYQDLQALHDEYMGRGLVVLAVPSDDFAQELDTDAEVKEFCELNYDLDLPITSITHVKGDEAHPFFRWLADTQGFEPQWNFNKVLIGADGAVLGTWGAGEVPTGPAIRGAIEAALGS